jgi:streptogramin lyase
VTRDNREVVRIDPESGALEGEPAQVPGAFNVAVGESAAWALGAKGSLTRLDPENGQPAGEPLPVVGALDVAAGLGHVWVAGGDGTVTRYDPGSGARVGEAIRVGPSAQALTIGEGSVWVADARDRAVYRITP